MSVRSALRGGALGIALAVNACRGDPVASESSDSAADSGAASETASDTASGATDGTTDVVTNDVADDTARADDAPATGDVTANDVTTNDVTTSDPSASDGKPTAPKSQEDCPRMPGPKMAFLAAPKAYCIDETEVTDAQFNQFILASDKATPGLPAYCTAQLATLKPTSLSLTLPAVNVAWCHAYAYCRWAGKRLCGGHGGGGYPLATSLTSAYSQWAYACRGGDPGAQFPYGGGSAHVDGTCVGDDAALTSVKPVDDPQYPDCHGSGEFATLMHMAGNAREWEDSCDGAPSATTTCRARGGAWTSPWNELNCGAAELPITTANDTTGFRCCYDGT